MTMVLVLVVVLAVLCLVGALEVTRRAVAGRQMEQFYDALRPGESESAPLIRQTPRVRRRPAVPAADRRLDVPVRRAS